VRRSWTITILHHEQADEGVWQDVADLVRDWNATETATIEPVLDFMYQANFDERDRDRLDRLVHRLQDLERTRGRAAAYHLASRVSLDEDDYRRADFVELLGTDLEMTPPLVMNEAEAFAPPSPCPRCGWQDPFDVAVASRLVVDETRLHVGVAGGPPPGPGGWDVVHLPNGDKLVSQRFVAVLRDNDVRGYELHDVIDAATGSVSPRVFHLTAKRAILVPCPEHTKVDGDGFCPECGTAHGNVDGYVYVRSDWVGDDEVISRHPRRGAMLYVSRRVKALLDAAPLEGLQRGDVLMVCQH
jgi:hypothetical protein